MIGIGLLIGGGAAAWLDLEGLAIAGFLGAYVLQNLRRPLIIGYLADRFDHCSMASGLTCLRGWD